MSGARTAAGHPGATAERGAPVIDVSGLSFSYDVGRTILEDVDFTIPAGDFASIIGPNGGGKTTLLKLVLGLLRPVQGRIKVFGTMPAKARKRIGYLPQHSAVDPHFPVSVMEVVLMGRLNTSRRFGPYTRTDRIAARRALDRVGLGDLKRRSFPELSGGEQQRVLVARALASEPELLLLDEPSAGLDQKAEHEFFDLLCELNRAMTIVLVSHDLGFVSQFVRTVVCVRRKVQVHPTSAVNGRIIREIYGDDVHMVRHDHSAR